VHLNALWKQQLGWRAAEKPPSFSAAQQDLPPGRAGVSSITTWRNNWRSGKEFRQPFWLALHVAFTPQLLATWE
jgi:hypothetical protein